MGGNNAEQRWPHVGQIVMFRLPRRETINGQQDLPAVITSVHGPDCVNLRVIADGEPHKDRWETSVSRAGAYRGEASIEHCWYEQQ